MIFQPDFYFILLLEILFLCILLIHVLQPRIEEKEASEKRRDYFGTRMWPKTWEFLRDIV
jgi:hypothetical protein